MKTPKQPVHIQTYRYSSWPSANDRILIFTRSHIFYPAAKILFIASVISVFIILFSIFFFSIYFSPILLITACGILFTLGMTLIINTYVSWYFHFYLVTTRKIVEVCNIPFGKYFINEILLDRVKCTEVDINSNGVINQLLRIGDVVVTFDRPTKHRDSFIFINISNSNTIKELLTDYFIENADGFKSLYREDKQRGIIYPLDEAIMPKLHA